MNLILKTRYTHVIHMQTPIYIDKISDSHATKHYLSILMLKWHLLWCHFSYKTDSSTLSVVQAVYSTKYGLGMKND